MPTSLDAPAFDHILSGARDNANQTLASLRAQVSTLQTAINSLQATIASQEATTELNVAHLQDRVSEMTALIDLQRVEIISASSEIKADYTESSAEMTVQFNQEVTDRELRFAELVNDLNEIAKTSIDNLTRHEKSARDIVQVVGNIGVTGNYDNVAISESKQANLWRWITIGLFGISIAIVLVSAGVHVYQQLHGDEGSGAIWQFLVRIATATIIALPAFYTARESARHRTNADRARQKELELASLGPFIELLPDPTKEAIRERMADRYFGSDAEPHDIKSPISVDDAAKLIDVVAKVLSSAKP